MSCFHEAHFGKAALDAFARDFLSPDKAQPHDEAQHDDKEEDFYDEEYYYEHEEDDGLGYYPDGVKRTLTDDQIAMFRHSELQALQRAHDKAQDDRANSSDLTPAPKVEEGELPDGDTCGSEGVQTPVPVVTTKKKNKKRGSGKGKGRGRTTKDWSPDPERRKRTWDVVETGLDGLDYGETGTSASPAGHVAQRRKITYDDG